MRYFALLLLPMAFGAAAQQLYIYPDKGQSQEQQNQDRFECHQWAVQQTGFDPSTYQAATPNSRPTPPVARADGPDINPVTGAAGGAAMGAVGGAIAGNAGQGAAIGAGIGAVAGLLSSISRSNREQKQQAQEQQRQLAEQAKQRADVQQQRTDYNRAMAACLEGRGYTVK